MTCSHMSYFFISKQLLWELFFRISNSKKIPFTDADKKSLENIFVEAQKGVSFWGVQNSSDNPRKNIMTVCLNYKATTDWGMQYLFSASLIYYREKRNGTFSDWVQIK